MYTGQNNLRKSCPQVGSQITLPALERNSENVLHPAVNVLYIRLTVLTMNPKLYEMDRLHSCISVNSTAYIAARYVVCVSMHRLIASSWLRMQNTDALRMLLHPDSRYQTVIRRHCYNVYANCYILTQDTKQ